MRLIRITTNYPAYLQAFYRQHPELSAAGYAEHYHALMADCYGWADFWTHAFGKLGYAVWEPVGNAEPMQKAWAREHGLTYQEPAWLLEIMTAQVAHFQPDIVFVNDYVTYPAEFFHHLRRQCPSIRLVIGWCGAPYQDGSVFNAYDVVLSNIPGLVTHFREQGHACEYAPHAFAPQILEHIQREAAPRIPFSFLGSLFLGQGFHNQRGELLKYLARKTKLRLWTDITFPSKQELRRIFLRQTLYDLVQLAKRMPGSQRLLPFIPKIKHFAAMNGSPTAWFEEMALAFAKRTQPACFGVAMYQKLSESQVTLNTHIDISRQSASNMRLYEATGVGTCLLTEAQDNLRDFFEPEREVVTYRSPEEACEKVRFLLSHPQARQEIAQNGQRRTLCDHTFEHRARQIETIIRKHLQAL